jgi:histidinol phosphatase-like PHP family hydrolase
MANLSREMEELGMLQYGVSDHYHSRYNYPNLASARNEFLEARKTSAFHFGAEVSVMSRWECEKIAAGDYVRDDLTPVYGIREGLPPDAEYHLDMNADDVKTLGLEYVIGGCHWPLHFPGTQSQLIDDYYEQLMYLATHPLVDIVAHPWWSLEMIDIGKGFCKIRKPYDFAIFEKIPQRFFENLGQAFVDNGKLAEINAGMIIPRVSTEDYARRYLKMLVGWKEQGVRFSFGDDLHEEHFNRHVFSAAEAMLTHAGFTEEDFYLTAFMKN